MVVIFVLDGSPDDNGPVTRPALRRLHANQTITHGNQSSYRYWSGRTTDEIIRSLRPGSKEPLLVKQDGTVMQGNTRTLILEERGVDINSLERVPYP